MKKYLFLASLLALACMSCEGPMGPPGESGEGVNWKILTYTVRESDWRLVGGSGDLNSYYMYEFKENAVSNFIYTDGNVFGYLIQNPGQKDEVQTPLPFVIPRGESDNYGSEFLFTEIYSFDFMPGSIAFYVNYSDFETGIRPPTCDFRIVLNW
jgi:hypothetical protein